MYMKKTVSILLAALLFLSLMPTAAAIDYAVYGVPAGQAETEAPAPAENIGPRSFMTASPDEAAGDGASFNPYVFTIDENAAVSASVQMQPALMRLPSPGATPVKTGPVTLAGIGTLGNPYRIGTAAQLEKFRDIVNGANGETMNASACAVLTTNVDLGNAAWTPIDSYEGVFDGDGFVISGLNVTGVQHAGLFNEIISGGSVTRLGVQGSVSAEGEYGASAGGIAAELKNDAALTRCWFEGTVSARDTQDQSVYAGGLVGAIDESLVSDCWHSGTVQAENNAGGAVFVGGVAGNNFASGLLRCYHTGGSVSGVNNGGGDSEVGGVGGSGDFPPSKCYYLNGTAPGGFDGLDVSGAAEALTEDQFKVSDNFDDWDFAETWDMDGTAGRPLLYFKHNSTVSVSADDVPMGATAQINVTVTTGATGNVTLFLGHKGSYLSEIDTVPIADGVLTLDLPYGMYQKSGNYTVKIVYNGDSRFNSSEDNTTFAVYEDGDGSPLSPYRIGCAAQLERFRDIVAGENGETSNSAAWAILTADVDLENVPWTPIHLYAGVFDGCGHVISGLNVAGVEEAGLFDCVLGNITRLGVQGSVSANGTGSVYAGGIAAIQHNGTITESWFEGTVRAENDNAEGQAGGIAGKIINQASIAACRFGGSVVAVSGSGSPQAGGIIGASETNDNTVSDCYAVCSVHAESSLGGGAYAGGVAGTNPGSILRCYHTGGNVTALCWNPLNNTIENGSRSGIADINAEGCCFLNGTAPGEGLTAEQFRDTGSFPGWDFDGIWYMDTVEGRPMFRQGKKDVSIALEIEPSIGFGEAQTINVTLSSADAAGHVVLAVEGPESNETHTIALTGGIGSQVVTGSFAGLYNLTFTYSGDDQYLRCMVRSSFIVEVGQVETAWGNLQAVIGGGGGTVTLTENVTCTNQTLGPIVIPKNTNVTLDLHGYTIDRGLTNATANGSVIAVEGSLTILDSVGGGAVAGGKTTGFGGAIYVGENASLIVIDCAFTNNSASSGGAIYADSGASLTVTNCTFTNNTADDASGFSAIHCPNTNTTVTGSVFLNNTAECSGVVGDAWDLVHDGLTVENCIFIGNAGGGDIDVADGSVRADGNWFGNTADAYTSIAGTVQGGPIDNWCYLNLTRTIDDAGQYALQASMWLYNSTSNKKLEIAPSDYRLPTLLLDGAAQNASFTGSGALSLSPAGYTAAVFAPDGANYTVGFTLHGFADYSGQLNFSRTIEANGGENLTYTRTSPETDTIRAFENGKPIPVAVLAGKNVTMEIGGNNYTYTLDAGGSFLPDLSNETPGSHDILVTVPGFAPLETTIAIDKFFTPMAVTPAESYFVGEAIPIEVNLPENATGNVTVAGNGINVTSEIHDGIAVCALSGLAVGTFTMNVSYTGDNNYYANETFVNLTFLQHSGVVTLSVNPDGGGTVTGNGTYTLGTNVTVTATPDPAFDFEGWAQGGTVFSTNASYTFTLTADTVLTANFTKKTFAVRFLDENGTVLQSGAVEYGQTPAYTGQTPTKAATAEFTYSFTNWTPAIGPVTGEANYTAVYSSAKNAYIVRFLDENGTVLQSGAVEYGQTPVFTGETPTKAATAEFTYAFTNWTPAIGPVTGAANYTAAYSSVKNTYTVRFLDENGTVLQSGAVEYGQMPAYTGQTPTKAATAEFTYTFTGWTPAIGPVTGAANYTAVYSSVKNTYTVRFLDENGTVLQNGTVEYGQTPAYTGQTPTKAATAEFTYSFTNWTPAIVPVTGAANYTAAYSSVKNTYTVCFLDENGTVLQNSTVEYGQTPAYTGQTPTKAATAEFTYSFTNWTPAIVPVTGAANYTAVYSGAKNAYTVRFLDENGTVLQSGAVEYGQTPAYTGQTPTKAVTAEFAYPFTGWTPEIVPVTGDADYTAVYTEIFVGATVPPEPKLPFTDVLETDAFYGSVKYVCGKNLMNGVSDTRFAPNGTLTRGMIVTILYRMEDCPTISYSGEFSDVQDDQWYTDGIEWAARNGIVDGYEEGRYGPNDPVTREQLAVILYRYAVWKGYRLAGAEKPADADEISPYAVEATEWAIANGFLLTEDGAVRPTERALRWEIAVVIEAFLKSFAEE